MPFAPSNGVELCYETFGDPADPRREPHAVRYPAAGTPNPEVTLHVLALAESEPLRALSLYALGVRAEGEGRRAEAADWYQLARLAGAPDEREARWATERLDALAEAPP